MQVLQDLADVVDRLLHFFVIALVGVGDQLINLAAGDWARIRLPSPMGSRIASSMILTPRTISAYALELLRLAALAQPIEVSRNWAVSDSISSATAWISRSSRRVAISTSRACTVTS